MKVTWQLMKNGDNSKRLKAWRAAASGGIGEAVAYGDSGGDGVSENSGVVSCSGQRYQ